MAFNAKPVSMPIKRVVPAIAPPKPIAEAPRERVTIHTEIRTDGTWRDMVRKYGRQYGVRVSDKMNPQAQTAMMKELLRENSQALASVLKRQPTDGELYIAHFAGAGGAKKLLKAKGTQYASAVLPAAANANRSIFYSNGKPRTVDEVLTILERKVT